MRMSVWQFLGLVLILAAIWFVVFIWGANQDKDNWISKMNSWFLESEEEINEPEPDPVEASGWVR